MLTHNDFDFDSMKNKTLEDLTKEEKEYLSRYVSMKIPKQFYQYVVSYVRTNPYPESLKSGNVYDIYPTFGEAYDGMMEFFNLMYNPNFKFYIEEDRTNENKDNVVYEVNSFYKDNKPFSSYKVTISRIFTTFWPETQFVTHDIIKKAKGV